MNYKKLFGESIITPVVSSARDYSSVQENLDKIVEYSVKKDAALFETARETKAQRQLLEQQLLEVKEQNNQLKENYNLLKELYEAAKNDAVESKKEANRSRIFGWISLGVGTILSILGIVIGAII